MILLIDNYDSFSYNLYQLIGEIEPDIRVIRNDEMTVEQIRELHPDRIILSPGPGRPEDALFLPLYAVPGAEPTSPLLPLTHPRTYLARRALPPGHPLAQNEETLLRFSAEERELRFLALTSALLGQPFAALLARSPVSGPALPALLAREEQSPRRAAPVRPRRSQPHAAPQ